MDARVAQLEADYEELLGKSIRYARRGLINVSANRKDYTWRRIQWCRNHAGFQGLLFLFVQAVVEPCASQNKLEAQYAAKRDAHLSEVTDLKQQLEMRSNEIRILNGSIDSLKSVNEELKVKWWKLARSQVRLNYGDSVLLP